MERKINRLKEQYLEAKNALKFSKMMSINEKEFWQNQRLKAGKALENLNVNLSEL